MSSSSSAASTSTFVAAVVTTANAPFSLEHRALPKASDLKSDEVLIAVEACGVCHSDVVTKAAIWPGLSLPRVCGHEVVGSIALRPNDSVSSVPKRFAVGVRVGRGWHGFSCLQCEPCLRGDFVHCESAYVTGVNVDGGYQEYMVAPWQSLAIVPDKLSSQDAAPLLCAGLTVFNALRKSQVPVPGLVAVQGLGGLGHLAVQYASKMGYRVVAISRGADKKALAEQLGAHEYIDSTATDPVKALKALGGAAVIVATGFDSDAMSALVGGLQPNGRLAVVGADVKPLSIAPTQLIVGAKTVQGHEVGTAMDAQDALNFAALHNVRAHIELFPLEEANKAFERMMSGKAKFRVVLETKHNKIPAKKH